MFNRVSRNVIKQLIRKKSTFLIVLFVGLNVNAIAQLEKVKDYYKKLEIQQKDNPVELQFINKEMDLVKDFSKLTQIVLLRHAEPALEKNGWRNRKDAIQFVFDYDSVGVFQTDYKSFRIQENELNKIYTSSLNRSIHTAMQLFDREDIQISDTLFREFERKILAFPNVKLPLKSWLTTSRVLWVLGLNRKGIESFSKAKLRACVAADFLEKDALKEGKTLLVAHGFFNHYLAKCLVKNGWIEVFDGGKGYLSQKVLVKYEGN